MLASHSAPAPSPSPNPVLAAPPALPAGSVAQLLTSAERIGVRRVALMAIQLLTELQLAQASRVALEPVSPQTVLLLRPETPFEQATIRRASPGMWRRQQEQEGLRAVGGLLGLLLTQGLYLEDSITDPARFGGAPLTRRRDRQLLQGFLRALQLIRERCEGGGRPYASPSEAMTDLGKLVGVAQHAIEVRRPTPPVTTTGHPAPNLPLLAKLPKVVFQPNAPAAGPLQWSTAQVLRSEVPPATARNTRVGIQDASLAA